MATGEHDPMSRHERTGSQPTLASRAWSVVADNPLLLAVGVAGFAVSYQTVGTLAVTHGLPGWPVLYPVIIDLGFLALTVESRKAIAGKRSDLVPRLLAWVLGAFTVYANAHGSPSRDWLGVALHVAAPGMWMALLEITRWRAVRRRRAMECDRIPVARWLLSPWRSWRMWRRMVLCGVASYPVAVQRELALRAAGGLARVHWPARRGRPPLLAHHLRAGTLPPAVALACENAAAGMRDGVAEAVEAWVDAERAAQSRARQKAAADRRASDVAAVAQAAPAAARQDAPAGCASPAPRRTPPERQERAAGGAPASQAAAAYWRANPHLGHADVAAEMARQGMSVSRRTLDRVKDGLRREGVEFPGRRLEAV